MQNYWDFPLSKMYNFTNKEVSFTGKQTFSMVKVSGIKIQNHTCSISNISIFLVKWINENTKGLIQYLETILICV